MFAKFIANKRNENESRWGDNRVFCWENDYAATFCVIYCAWENLEKSLRVFLRFPFHVIPSIEDILRLSFAVERENGESKEKILRMNLRGQSFTESSNAHNHIHY